MIELAKDEIFIGSWWICPELYMKRPMAEGDKWRLDQMLCRAAKRGVHIFILQYNELGGAFGHNSLAGKKKLKKLHKNIKVSRLDFKIELSFR
jgi:phospholipase D1/2